MQECRVLEGSEIVVETDELCICNGCEFAEGQCNTENERKDKADDERQEHRQREDRPPLTHIFLHKIPFLSYLDEKTGIATISQRNRFFVGDEIEIIQPGKPFFCQTAKYMENEAGERIECAPHAQMIVKMPVDFPVTADAMLRKVSTKKGM